MKLVTTPKLPPPAPEREEQVVVLRLVRRDEPAIGQDDICLDQIVDRQPVAAGEVAGPATEGQAGDSGGGDDAGRHGQAERVGRMVHVALSAAGPDAHGSRLGVHAQVLHWPHVDDEPIVAASQPRAVVSTATQGDEQALLSTEANGCDDVRDVRALSDQRGTLVDHAVVE